MTIKTILVLRATGLFALYYINEGVGNGVSYLKSKIGRRSTGISYGD